MLKKILIPISAALAILLGVLFFLFILPPGSVKLELSARPRVIVIGDPVECVLTVTSPKSYEIRFPENSDKLRKFEVRTFEDSTSYFLAKKTVKRTYIITSYKSGNFMIPPLTVQYRKHGGVSWEEKETPKIFIKVGSLIRADLEAEQKVTMSGDMVGGMKAPKSDGMGAAYGGTDRFIDTPVRFPIAELRPVRMILTPTDVAIYSGIAISGAILFFFILSVVIATIRNKPEPEEPSPDERAIQRLRKLRLEGYLKNGKKVEFCSELSSLLVEYVQARYGLTEKVMTVKEFVIDLISVQQLTENQKNFLKDRLILCDLVRFSPYDMNTSELSDQLEEEFEFIEQTRPRAEEGE